MKNLKKITFLSIAAALYCFGIVSDASAQERERVVKPVLSQPVNQPTSAPDQTRSNVSSKPTNLPVSRPTLTNEINVSQEYRQSLVKKTGESSPVNAVTSLAKLGSRYSSATTTAMMQSIRSKIGIRYRYGSTGPDRYDCSGFVWSVFADAGMNFTRQSASSLWSASEPVAGDERFRFGTLVFMNRLGHVGIVADENGFYHASSSKGITYSPFKGYWEKRIVGFRRLVPTAVPTIPDEEMQK